MTNWSKVRSNDIMHKAFLLHLYVSKHSFKWNNHFQLFLTIPLKKIINAVEDDEEGNMNVQSEKSFYFRIHM